MATARAVEGREGHNSERTGCDELAARKRPWIACIFRREFRGRQLPSIAGLHVRAKQRVDLGLIALALRAKPRENVRIKPQRDLLLHAQRRETFANESSCKPFRTDFWKI